jgi:LysM repeat protein
MCFETLFLVYLFRENKIKQINDVSDTIYPGMKLKFPKECQPSQDKDSLSSEVNKKAPS